MTRFLGKLFLRWVTFDFGQVRRPITSRRALNYVQRLRDAPLLYFQVPGLETIPFLLGLRRPDLFQEIAHFIPYAIGREVRAVPGLI